MNRTITLALLSLLAAYPADACTSAIVSPEATPAKRILLWKHRDTGTTDNFIARFTPTDSTELAFVGLFNAGDSTLAEAWAGMNQAGFAIINTASYNLAPDTAQFVDQEAVIMTEALKHCRSLEDFEKLLENHPKPMGVQANFGVIDSTGQGAYYETDDYSYRRYLLSEAPLPMLIRTNFSVSGTQGHGKGLVRYANATTLLRPKALSGQLSPTFLTDTVSTSFYNDNLGFSPMERGDKTLVDNGDFIPRRSTSASVVIEGGEQPRMWVRMGYPPVGHTELVTMSEIPLDLLPDNRWHCQASDSAAKLRDKIIKRKHSANIVNLDRLRKVQHRQ